MTSPLRVSIVHYHLRTGGVTRVIQHAVSALRKENVQVAVLTGEPPTGSAGGCRLGLGYVDKRRIAGSRDTCGLSGLPTGNCPENVRVVEGLGYGKSVAQGSSGKLVERLEAAAKAVLGAAPDIWHFHNHSVGKNLSVPSAVYSLAKAGRRLLLQIHDFAEDGRPGNYRLLLDGLGRGDVGKLGALLYPQAPQVHYAALNGRDLEYMTSAGVARDRLHPLPNAVSMEAPAPEESIPPSAAQSRLFVYPTRGIRRKNLGEFLLWSAVTRDECRFATTLAPKNPKAWPVYQRWVRFARALGLPVDFDIAGQRQQSFTAVLRSANALVTTSVAEGFGMCFLEPWIVERPLLGRNLQEITQDFSAAGLDLSGLYDRLDVPLTWVGEEALRERIRSALAEYFQAYGRQPYADAEGRAFSAFVEDDKVDFGRLDEPLQERVIRKVRESRGARDELRPVCLESRGALSSEIIEHNRRTVLREFSLDHYGERLRRIYERIMASDVAACDALPAETLLAKFLSPERFCLMRAS